MDPETRRGRREEPSPEALPLALRVVLSAIFVASLVLLLSQPLLRAGLDEPGSAPRRDATPPERSDRYRPVRTLASDVPLRCLRAATSPSGFGRIAAFDGQRVQTSDGEGIAFETGPPVSWSPSGRYLASGSGRLWDADGTALPDPFGGPVEEWAWSPRSDCLVGLESGRLELWSPRGTARTLVRAGVDTFAVSPDGTKLLLVLDAGEGWDVRVADLDGGDVARDTRLANGRARVLLGWLLNEPILVKAPPARVAGAAVIAALPGAVAKCAGELVSIAPPYGAQGRLVSIPGPGTVGAATGPYRAVACGPDGSFAVVRVGSDRDRLSLLDAEGALQNVLTPEDGRDDAEPRWGPAGTGIVFVRATNGGTRGEVWAIAEGDVVRPAGLSIRGRRGTYAHAFDWSADPPPGYFVPVPSARE